jgi:hypothetical protein
MEECDRKHKNTVQQIRTRVFFFYFVFKVRISVEIKGKGFRVGGAYLAEHKAKKTIKSKRNN